MKEPSAEQIAFAERWLYADTADAFPELPPEMVAEIARRRAPNTAAALFGRLAHEEINISGCNPHERVLKIAAKQHPKVEI